MRPRTPSYVELEGCDYFPYSCFMSINLPADAETERLAHYIAEATGRPLPTVVREAIAAKAEAEGVEPRRGRKKLDLDRIQAIIDRSAGRPVLDKRTADEIVGYDDSGVPR